MPLPNIVTCSFTVYPMYFKKPLVISGVLLEEMSLLYISFHWNCDNINNYIVTTKKISTCDQTARFRNIVMVLLIGKHC